VLIWRWIWRIEFVGDGCTCVWCCRVRFRFTWLICRSVCRCWRWSVCSWIWGGVWGIDLRVCRVN
jgi:hypothetical protein